MKTSITSGITDGQKKQYKRFVEDAAERALAEVGLDRDSIQKLIERGNEFQADIVASIRKLSVSNRFSNKEVSSSYGYLSGYRPKSIAEQVKRLRELFPELGSAGEHIATSSLPPNAEGWFAIPRREKIAPTYGEAVQRVLDLLKKTRNGKFCNYREGQLGSACLRQSRKISQALCALGEEQKGHDILIVPCQFGFRHRGRSVRRAREVMNASEFGLGAYEVGIMLLTHPERFQHQDDLWQDDLWIDCAGDEFAPPAVGGFAYSPYFYFGDGKVEFGADWVSNARGNDGSASAFL